jgi:phenylpyruvate tautomerase PptA (4-oxalocrotonate tautomerase family)
VHHEVTQAPEPYVRIVFQPMPLGLMYSAGEIAPSFILGAGCRGGRSDATRHELLHELYDVIREVTDLPPDQIVVAVTDTPPSWLMEAGMVLPETNHEAEAAWMKKLQERFPGKYDDE